MYEYKAKILRVVDGDTIELLVDMGMNRWSLEHIRFSDIDTAELRSSNAAERQHAQEAKAYVQGVFAPCLEKRTTLREHLKSHDLTIRTQKEGSFGRFIASVYPVGDGVSLGLTMKDLGLAKKSEYPE